MTIAVVILVGAGTLLIASALDCTPIVTTFQKIVSGQSVDWTGQANQCGQQVTGTGADTAGSSTTSPKWGGSSPGGCNPPTGTCPAGTCWNPRVKQCM